MENTNNGTPRRPNPRRRRRSRIQKIIRAYFPVAVVLVLVVLFIIFATNSVKRANEKREQERLESIALEESKAKVQQEMEEEAKALVKEADKFAASCEFDKALAHLDTFAGNPEEFDVIQEAKERYENGESHLVPVADISQVKCLSFSELLLSSSVFTGAKDDGNRLLYITVDEFNRILQQLYENDYMLVDIYDLFTTGQNEDGSVKIQPNDLRLPQGKKPIMLVNTQAAGYARKLVLTEDGSFVSEYTDGDKQLTGSVDFVPLLEDFIRSNPGFSYKGSRAMLALTGHKGLFGYDISETAEITRIAQALTERGYILSCNTFGNLAYGYSKLAEIQEDVSNWNISAVPLIGQTEVLVYARGSDIYDGKDSYFGSKYEALFDAGFHYYLGICYNSNPWMDITGNTIRLGRILVTGENLTQKTAFFEGLFDASKVVETK